MTSRVLALFLSLVLVGQAAVAQDLNLARRHFEQRRYPEAQAIYSTVRKGDARFAESRYYLGMISMRQGDHAKAESFLKEAVSANGKDARFHIALANLYGQMAADAGTVRQAQLANRARGHLESAAALDERDIATRVMLIEFYNRAPRIMGGDINKSRQVAQHIMGIDRAEGNRAMAMVERAAENSGAAERHYRQAMELAPDSLKHYTTLASFYQSQSRTADALNVYDRAINRFSTNRSLLLQAGRIASGGGAAHGDRGMRYLKSYLEMSPGSSDRNLPNVYYYMGIIERDRRNIAAARNHFNEALRINPSHRPSQQALAALGS